MGGVLPGVHVEYARRRRLHQSVDKPGGAAVHGWTRRSSLCLYTSNHETYHYHTSMSSPSAYDDEKLGGVAREARERLDERQRMQRKSKSTRQGTPGSKMIEEGRSVGAPCELRTEVFGVNRSTGSKRFNWAKFSWESGEQDECTICLEGFKPGEILVHLPCAHRFHSGCLVHG